MRWAKRVISILLVIAAVVVVLAALFSDHRSDYGQVRLPQGGVVELPKGDVVVYWRSVGDQDVGPGLTGTLSLSAVPVGGGDPVPQDVKGESSEALQRSEAIGELGAVSTLKVPAAGSYMVSGGDHLTAASTYLSFGVNSATALLHEWKLVAILLGAALLLWLIPVPPRGRHWDESEPTPGWGSDPRAPYAG